MKTKINQLIKIGILTFGVALFFLTSCETDNESIQTNQEQQFSIKEVAFTEFNTNSRLLDKISSIERTPKNKTNTASRTNSPDEAYDINTNHAIYIENSDGTHHTYTFAVNSQDESPELENIVLSLQEDGSYKAYLTKYNLTEQELADLDNGLELNVSEESTSITEVSYDQVNFMSRMGCSFELVTIEVEHACTIDGCWDPQYTTIEYINVWVEVCSGGGGGGSGDGSGTGTGSGGGGGGTGSGGGGSVPTKPVGIQNEEDPCNPAPEGDINGNCMLEYFEACFVDTNILRNFNNQELDGIASFIDNTGCNQTSQSIVQFVANENCEANIVMDSWSSNLSENEEPKWGQLANKQEIIDEVNNIPGLNDLPYSEQITALANHFEKNLMYTRNSEGELEIINPLTDVNRYIYSQVGGWIDFHHVFKIFEWATENGPFNALTQGELGEMWQSLKDNHSAYSYEDLPSNLLGVGMYVRFSQDLAQGNITWAEAVETTLNEINCIEPELAPNFDYIPHIVNGHYPQNFTYSPILGNDLREYHKQKFCERPINEQLNIKEAHEKFPR